MPRRTIVGTALRKSTVWFFKLSGPVEEVAGQETPFLDFLATVDFEETPAATPTWQLPDGWKAKEGNSFRYATLVIPGEQPPLEVSVSTLAYPGNQDEYLLMNANRWRRELSLPPIGLEQVKEQFKEIAVAGGNMFLMDIAGQGSGGGMVPPFAGGNSTPGQVPARQTTPAATEPPFKYETPEGWTSTSNTAFSQLAFEITSDAGVAKVTVSKMPAHNTWDPNVRMWCSQVQVSTLTADELAKLTKSIDVGGIAGKSIELDGPQDSPDRKKLIGIMAADKTSAWFIKITGPFELVTTEQEQFQQFVSSIEF